MSMLLGFIYTFYVMATVIGTKVPEFLYLLTFKKNSGVKKQNIVLYKLSRAGFLPREATELSNF